jgi:hypothetical protein
VKLGLQLNSFDWNGGPERFGRALVEIAQAAEEAGLDREPERRGDRGLGGARPG